jgi:hypothetical protein
VLVADDPRVEAALVVEELEQDPTAEELATSFTSRAVVAAHPAPAVLEALCLRPDLEIRLVGEGSTLRWATRVLSTGGSVSGFLIEETAASLVGAGVAVIEVCAAGPQGCVADRGARALAAEARTAGVPLWAVAGVGRVLPAPLFAALAARAGETEIVPPSEITAVVRPDGIMAPGDALERPDCPALLELTH